MYLCAYFDQFLYFQVHLYKVHQKAIPSVEREEIEKASKDKNKDKEREHEDPKKIKI